MANTEKKIFLDETITEVRRTWNLLNGDLQAVGIEVLLRLFKKYPTYQQLFSAFKETPFDELKNKIEFQKHALAVASAVNKAVEELDDTNKLVELLGTVGKAHIKRNITPVHFMNIETVILESIQQALATNSTEKILDAWKEVLKVAVSAIAKGAEVSET